MSILPPLLDKLQIIEGKIIEVGCLGMHPERKSQAAAKDSDRLARKLNFSQ